jgi:signal transduction histidine kinase
MVDGDFAARIPIDQVESELGQLARALNDAFDRLHASFERQRRFTADASHELRTPLATISAEVQWALGRERDGAAYRGALETCARAAARMLTIVERLLTLARAEAEQGSSSVRIAADVHVESVVRAAIAELEPLARARHVTIRLESVPTIVRGDEHAWFDAITNVIANAIQYNVDGGSVLVRVRRPDGHVEVVVTDTGPGIASEDLPRVFEPFFRADRARSRDRGGAGLGLAVTRATVRAHGGDVTCESAPGTGTTITIRVPHEPV